MLKRVNDMSRVTIVMYHYVRDLKHSRYPEIKGLDIDLFDEQIRYILKYYKVIRMEEVVEAVLRNKNLPDNSLLLTFDDAYRDHFDFVFPILDKFGIQGSFFPHAKAIKEHRVLDVNKIHFILASIKDKKRIISDIYSAIDKYREEYSLEPRTYYNNKLKTRGGRFDTKEVLFIKKMLQSELPEKVRNIIIDFLFCKHVTRDEGSFSHELYMNIDQLKCMKKNGMYIGSHGYDHHRLNTLSREQQLKEIEFSMEFLKELGCSTENFVFCYPYGSYNKTLLSILKEKGCSLALTTHVGIAEPNRARNLFALPRLDANDMPKNSLAKPNKWTLKVASQPESIVFKKTLNIEYVKEPV